MTAQILEFPSPADRRAVSRPPDRQVIRIGDIVTLQINTNQAPGIVAEIIAILQHHGRLALEVRVVGPRIMRGARFHAGPEDIVGRGDLTGGRI